MRAWPAQTQRAAPRTMPTHPNTNSRLVNTINIPLITSLILCRAGSARRRRMARTQAWRAEAAAANSSSTAAGSSNSATTSTSHRKAVSLSAPSSLAHDDFTHSVNQPAAIRLSASSTICAHSVMSSGPSSVIMYSMIVTGMSGLGLSSTGHRDSCRYWK
jgi:hypothetical protein